MVHQDNSKNRLDYLGRKEFKKQQKIKRLAKMKELGIPIPKRKPRKKRFDKDGNLIMPEKQRAKTKPKQEPPVKQEKEYGISVNALLQQPNIDELREPIIKAEILEPLTDLNEVLVKYENGLKTCEYCDMAFGFETDLETHLELTHEVAESKVKEEQIVEEADENEEENSVRFVCKYCNTGFFDQDEVMEHIQATHQEEDSDSDGELDQMPNGHPKNEQYEIDDDSIAETIKKDPDEDQEFSDKEGKELDMYTYEHCPKEFNMRKNRNRHVRRVHLQTEKTGKPRIKREGDAPRGRKDPNRPKKHKCGTCPYATSESADLRNHIKGVHEKIKDFTCPNCEYSTHLAYKLKHHIQRVHEHVKTKSCDKCPFTAAANYELTKHRKRVHEKIEKDPKEDPLKPKRVIKHCFMCEFNTTDKESLTKHLKSVHNT